MNGRRLTAYVHVMGTPGDLGQNQGRDVLAVTQRFRSFAALNVMKSRNIG